MDIYIIKSAVCLGILFAFYKIFLERENMHIFKRFYLIGILAVAYSIPFVTFTEYIEVQKSIGPVLTSENLTADSSEITPTINYLPLIIWSLYLLGVLFFSLKFSKNLFSIIQKINKNPLYKNKSIFHVLLKTPTTPHTFFSYIFLNKQKFEANEIPEEVLLHEQAHACERHSFDVLFIELLQIVFWFNPIIYFIKHSIKLNHEFLADRAVLSNGIETSYYQNILLAFSSNAGPPLPIVIGLANSINYSSSRLNGLFSKNSFGQVKKRFTVMKTQTSKRAIWFRSVFLLPLLAILIYGFSTKEIIELESADLISQMNSEKMSGEPIPEWISPSLFATNTIEDLTKEYVPSLKTSEQKYDLKVRDVKMGDNETGLVPLIAGDTPLKKIQLDKIITLKINNEQLEVNGKATTLANFAKTLNKIAKNWTDDEIANCRFDVIVQNSNDEFLEKLEREYQKTKLYEANPNNKLVPPQPRLAQVIVIDKIESDDVQVVELKIANKAVENVNNAVEVIEIKRVPNAKVAEIIEIKVAPQILIIDEIEPYENVPPPPPPPIAAKVTVKVIESVEAVKADIPPLPPPSDVNIKELAANGATFYLEGKEISSKKALKALEKNEKMNIEIYESTSGKIIVKLSKN